MFFSKVHIKPSSSSLSLCIDIPAANSFGQFFHSFSLSHTLTHSLSMPLLKLNRIGKNLIEWKSTKTFGPIQKYFSAFD